MSLAADVMTSVHAKSISIVPMKDIPVSSWKTVVWTAVPVIVVQFALMRAQMR